MSTPSACTALAFWPVRAEALPLARHLQQRLGGEVCQPWLDSASGLSQRQQFAQIYRRHRQWVVLGATGIAVRFLEGLPQDKHSDPAVVVLDEAARFAIALLAGHEGGANALAYRVAACTGAQPVITTATEAVKPLVLGIGCRKLASQQQIADAVQHALAQCAGATLAQVREVATIDIKAHEPGLLAFCAAHALPLRVIARAQIAARAWVGKSSDWVMHNVGVAGVCEPAALIASVRGRLLLGKSARDGVTVAVVEDAVQAWRAWPQEDSEQPYDGSAPVQPR